MYYLLSPDIDDDDESPLPRFEGSGLDLEGAPPPLPPPPPIHGKSLMLAKSTENYQHLITV
ncbi:hypothetical protein SK128_008026 [Halocaridina rubra]|uniref:Uncharacterized protein n=1 Tax=Halocaridina rubra TaxID=373956 RepID=A0AAN9AB80_HALRR